MKKLNRGTCVDKNYQDTLDKAKKIYPCIKLINYCCGCCLYPESAKECCWKNYQQFDLSKILNPFGRTQGKMCCICLWNNYPNEHTCGFLKRERIEFMSCCWLEKKKNMNKTKKTKNQIISVPTASQSAVKSKKFKKTSSTLTKPRPTHSKENTLDYYNCLINQVDNPLNDKVKITAMCHHCKHNKGKVKVVKQEEKQQLIKEVAKSYLTFGKRLGNLLHADVVCHCRSK